MKAIGECVKILLSGLHDDSGNELSGGKVYTYDAGTTDNKATYTDRGLTTPAANPIVLDANGKAQIYANPDALYKFIVKTSADVILTGGTWDNLGFGSMNIGKGTDVVSEAVLFTAAGFPTDGDLFDITGTTGITSMLTSGRIGTEITLHYDGVLIITQDGDNIVTPSAQNITTIAGDVIRWKEYASGKWEIVGITNPKYITSTTLVNPTIENTSFYNLNAGIYSRPQFTYNGGASTGTIKVGSGQYWCKDKFCWWDAELTTTQAESGTPTANLWYYLYLDYSDIISGTEIISAKLIWATTVPSYSYANRGWYNGDDRCIMACKANAGGTDFLEFFHSGDFVSFADYILCDIDGTTGIVDVDSTWLDVDLTGTDPRLCPAFTNKACMEFDMRYVDSAGTASWRTNGQIGTTGHRCGNIGSANYTVLEATVITDSNGIIEIKHSNSNGNTSSVRLHGWYFGTSI